MDFKFLIEIVLTIGGWCVMIGMYSQKIKQHDKEIEDLKVKSDKNTELLNEINKQLAELNTKMSLLINGRINTGDDGK